MGFFSYKCKGCSQSLRSYHAVTKDSSWMQSVIAYSKHGQFCQGAYDGYGRVDTGGEEVNLGDDQFTVYHQRCWRLLGRPKGFDGTSPAAEDQGYFTNFHPTKPRSERDLAVLRTADAS